MRRLAVWLTLLASVATAAVVATEPVEAATVPSGFSDTFIAPFNSPTTVEWVPGDRIVVLEQTGRVRVGRPGTGFTTAIDLNVCSGSERGLLGFTHDPAFVSNRFVYLYYTRPAGGTCVNRVSRFALGTDDRIDPASEFVLLDNISSINGNHNGGDLDVGSDGYLYVGVGDAGRDPRGDSGSGGNNDAAQDLSLLNGKVLRITLDGQPAPGNPLTGPGTARCAFRGNTSATPTSSCQEIFAWGLRNPFRFAFDRNDGTDRFFINDVGQNRYEEVSEGGVGLNYGWPTCEGPFLQGSTTPCSNPAFTDPLTHYSHTIGSYITAGAFVPNGLWPEEYDGGYLFADGGSGRIWHRTSTGSVDYGTPFATDAFGIVDMVFGFDAAGRQTLYYVTFGGLSAITPTTPLPDPPSGNLKIIPVEPFRAYDTGQNNVGVEPGKVVNGTTRHIDLDPPKPYEAALVNLTYDVTAGSGFMKVWQARGARPGTSSVNAERPGTIVANSAIVPLAEDGSFVLESTTTARVVIDVMAWLDDVGGGTTDDGRFIAKEPIRLADTRKPAGVPLSSGSPNPWTATADGFDVDVLGNVGVPNDGTVEAIVVSIAAIAGDEWAGWVSAYPGGGDFSRTSNVNVLRGQARANIAMVPFVDGGDHVSFRLLNVRDIVVDVVGYITSDDAPESTTGLYQPVETFRVVDTRKALGFGTLQPDTAASVVVPGAGSASALVHNMTVTGTRGGGHVSAHPTPVTPYVSNLNFDGPDQIRAVLAFTQLGSGGTMRYTSFTETDFVVDVLGYFSS